jgi:hypothetical protein
VGVVLCKVGGFSSEVKIRVELDCVMMMMMDLEVLYKGVDNYLLSLVHFHSVYFHHHYQVVFELVVRFHYYYPSQFQSPS